MSKIRLLVEQHGTEYNPKREVCWASDTLEAEEGQAIDINSMASADRITVKVLPTDATNELAAALSAWRGLTEEQRTIGLVGYGPNSEEAVAAARRLLKAAGR